MADPFFGDVRFLAQFQDPDGIVWDQSLVPIEVVATGDGVYDSDNNRWTPNGGDYFDLIAGDGDVYLGDMDFCIEIVARFPVGVEQMIFTTAENSPDAPLELLLTAAGVLQLYSDGVLVASMAGFPHQVYQWITVERMEGTLRLFVQGTQQGSDYVDATEYTHDGMRFGADAAGARSVQSGTRIENIRITVGTGRYGADYDHLAEPVPWDDYVATIQGTLLDDEGSPASYPYVALHRGMRQIIAQGFTSAFDGSYSVNVKSPDEVTILFLQGGDNDPLLNDKCIRVLPLGAP